MNRRKFIKNTCLTAGTLVSPSTTRVLMGYGDVLKLVLKQRKRTQNNLMSLGQEYSIIHMSDLHIGQRAIVTRDFLSGLVDEVNSGLKLSNVELKNRILYITGDIGNSPRHGYNTTESDLENTLGALDRLEIGHKVFCLGNHDIDGNPSMTINILEDLGFTFLGNSKHQYQVDGFIQLLGTPCFHSQYEKFDSTLLENLKKNYQEDMVTVLGSHDPAMIEHWFGTYCKDWSNTLILGGHTHGGQFASKGFRDRGNTIAHELALEKLRRSSQHKLKTKHIDGWYELSRAQNTYANISTGVGLHPAKPQTRTVAGDTTLITIK